MDTRQQLRTLIRQRRNSLSDEQQRTASFALRDRLLSIVSAQQTIALYLTNDGEIDTSPIIDSLKEQNTRLLFPVLHPFKKGYLNFQSVNRETQWTLNKYKINEPQLNSITTTPISNIDVILMPLVAFDQQGNRLGMGGGYYDRTLAQIQSLPAKPKLIGLAHDCQEVDSLPYEDWDVPIDAIVTPTRIINVSPQRLRTP